MFRKLATLVLAVPLALNGLWMVCEGGDLAPNPAARSAASGEKPKCTSTMCAMEKGGGPICILTSDDNKVSMTIFLFGVAVVPQEARLPQPAADGQYIPEFSALYLNPNLTVAAPPPKV